MEIEPRLLYLITPCYELPNEWNDIQENDPEWIRMYVTNHHDDGWFNVHEKLGGELHDPEILPGNRYKWNFESMKIMDYYLFQEKDERIFHSCRTSAYNYSKRTGIQFQTFTDDIFCIEHYVFRTRFILPVEPQLDLIDAKTRLVELGGCEHSIIAPSNGRKTYHWDTFKPNDFITFQPQNFLDFEASRVSASRFGKRSGWKFTSFTDSEYYIIYRES